MPRPDRFVDIFCFLTHGGGGPKSAGGNGPDDVAKILAQDPEATRKPDSPLWVKIGGSHYWSELRYGSYRRTDLWVLRRHAQLLADAGIGLLIFDTTTARLYPEVYATSQ